MIKSGTGLIVIVLCIVFGANRTEAQSLDSQLKNGMILIYQQHFQQADSLLVALEKQHPASIQVHLLGVNLYWHKWVMGDHQDALQKREGCRIRRAPESNETSAELTHGEHACVYALREHRGVKMTWQSALRQREALHATGQLVGLYSGFDLGITGLVQPCPIHGSNGVQPLSLSNRRDASRV